MPGWWLQACQAALDSRGRALPKSCCSAEPCWAAMAGLCRITSSSLAAVSSVNERISRSGGVCVRPVNRSRKSTGPGLPRAGYTAARSQLPYRYTNDSARAPMSALRMGRSASPSSAWPKPSVP